MTVWELALARRSSGVGMLPHATTRGDRLFIAPAGRAFIHLGLAGPQSATPPVVGSRIVGLVYAVGVFASAEVVPHGRKRRRDKQAGQPATAWRL